MLLHARILETLNCPGRVAAALLLAAAVATSVAAGTTFTYKGRLADGGTPLTALADLRLTLFDAGVAGSPAGTSLEGLNFGIVDGLGFDNLRLTRMHAPTSYGTVQ